MMYKKALIPLICLVLFSGCKNLDYRDNIEINNLHGNEIGLLNIRIFGTPLNKSIKLLENGEYVDPKKRPSVHLPLDASNYYSAIVSYDGRYYSFLEVCDTVKENYKMTLSIHDNKLAFGWSKKHEFSIHISAEKNSIQVIYTKFKSISSLEAKRIKKDALIKTGYSEFIPAMTGEKEVE